MPVRRWHRSSANSLEPSVAFTRPLHRCYVFIIRLMLHRANVYLTNKVHIAEGNKKPLHLRGLATSQIPLISRYYRRNWHLPCGFAGGLPGFTGPFPSTSLDESSISTVMRLYRCVIVTQLIATLR